MNRKKMLEKAFQRGHLLNLNNSFYKNWINRFIIDEMKGDVGIKGDITSNALFNGHNHIVDAEVRARADGIAAGIEEAVFIYKKNRIKARKIKKDGDKIRNNDLLLKLKGREKDLLKVERSASDLLERMCGIATLTDELLRKTKRKVGIAPTRKTQWRYLDKKAVYIGGGLTHRLALWDAILVKDNHIKALAKKKKAELTAYAIQRAWKKKNKAAFVEMEVLNQKQAIVAARKFKELQKNEKIPCLVMLDNMKPNKIKTIVAKLKKEKLYHNILLEASGGIDPKNIVSYAKTGVDVLSLGYLTNSSKALNIKQKIL